MARAARFGSLAISAATADSTGAAMRANVATVAAGMPLEFS
jgi:hypothetical protein